MPTNFKEEGKLEDLIALFMLAHKKAANISIILVEISVFCEALVLPNLRISFSTFPKSLL